MTSFFIGGPIYPTRHLWRAFPSKENSDRMGGIRPLADAHPARPDATARCCSSGNHPARPDATVRKKAALPDGGDGKRGRTSAEIRLLGLHFDFTGPRLAGFGQAKAEHPVFHRGLDLFLIKLFGQGENPFEIRR